MKMREWKHDPITAQNPLKFMQVLNDLSKQLEIVTKELQALKQKVNTRKPGRPKKEETTDGQ